MPLIFIFQKVQKWFVYIYDVHTRVERQKIKTKIAVNISSEADPGSFSTNFTLSFFAEGEPG